MGNAGSTNYSSNSGYSPSAFAAVKGEPPHDDTIVSSEKVPLIVDIEDAASPAGAGFIQLWPGYPSRHFQFTDFEQGISESSNPEYASTQVLGRAEQFKTYAGSTNREISLTFHFHVQGVTSSDVNTACVNEVVNPALWLNGLTQPVLVGGSWYPPPTVLLVIGSMLTLRSVVTSANIQWLGPWEPVSLNPHRAVVQATFTSVARKLGNCGAFSRYRNQVPTPFGG